ncbi:MAG: electron transport complex subunit RsxC [Clostridia bacterium]|nr:electron transport complex subunit RsxC [Clostridia bacterium]MEE1024516.1 electron transport complex subunit RsxC [Acutalibacteraceae bacterium]
MSLANIIKPIGRAKGGVNVPHRKNTANAASEIFTNVTKVAIPMQQHIGAPCSPCVKKGDTVYVGTLIGNSENAFSAPIHSSVSGTVSAIEDVLIASGVEVQAVIIESDGNMTSDPELQAPTVTNKEEFLKAVRDGGLVGLGGAGFPTHIKLNSKAEVDTLVVNAAECEPYITADCRTMLEDTESVINGIITVMDMLSLKETKIVIEDNKPEAIKAMAVAAQNSTAANKIKIVKATSLYPRGAEKMTIYLATGRRVPPGKLPSDVGCIVMNVTSISELNKYLTTGMPLVSKRITVDGSAISQPKNLIVPVGTYYTEILKHCGCTEYKKLINGGPMMGFSVPSAELPVVKQTNALLAFDEKDAHRGEITSCIRCGRCVKACPMSLMPTKIETHTKLNNAEILIKDGVMNCMECGSCAFECPAMRPLVQVMRTAKTIIKKNK